VQRHCGPTYHYTGPARKTAQADEFKRYPGSASAVRMARDFRLQKIKIEKWSHE
jgi:hypothetical protein